MSLQKWPRQEGFARSQAEVDDRILRRAKLVHDSRRPMMDALNGVLPFTENGDMKEPMEAVMTLEEWGKLIPKKLLDNLRTST